MIRTPFPIINIAIRKNRWTVYDNGQVNHECNKKRSIGWMSGVHIVNYCDGCRKDLPEYLQFIQRLYLLKV